MSTYPFSTLPTDWSFKDKCDLSLQKILWRLFIALRMKFKLLTMVYKTLNSQSLFSDPLSPIFFSDLSWSCNSMLNTLQHLLTLHSLSELTTLCQHTYLCFIDAIQSSWISLCTQFLACKVNSYSSIKTWMKYHIPCINFFICMQASHLCFHIMVKAYYATNHTTIFIHSATIHQASIMY